MRFDTTQVTELELKILQNIWIKQDAMTMAEIRKQWPGRQKPEYI